MTMTTILTETMDFPAKQSHCPCGCGHGNIDHPAVKYSILAHEDGSQELEITRSVDGGRHFYGGGWQPINTPEGIAYGLRMVAPDSAMSEYLMGRAEALAPKCVTCGAVVEFERTPCEACQYDFNQGEALRRYRR